VRTSQCAQFRQLGLDAQLLLDGAAASGTLAIPDRGTYIGRMSTKLAPLDRPTLPSAPVAWMVSLEPVESLEAIHLMEARADQIARGEADELVWLLEHSATYTAGTGARPEDLITSGRFPVHITGRGGKFTYHGPGQRVIYVMLDVKRRSGDVRAFVAALEAWVIDALAELGVTGERRPGRIGIWVRNESVGAAKIEEAKIAAIGLRLRHWVSMHGISLNVNPDLEHYSGIVPCGIAGYGVTSLEALGRPATMEAVDKALRLSFERCIGPVQSGGKPIELHKAAWIAS
jgi:lipoyl(octanoyl) transferase